VCSSDELAETSSPESLVCDAATRMFWRNVKARSAGAPVNKLGRKPARYDIPESVDVPAVSKFIVEVLQSPWRLVAVQSWP
jgi:hypothetical protein